SRSRGPSQCRSTSLRRRPPLSNARILLLLIRLPRRSTLFPYTTLFRSNGNCLQNKTHSNHLYIVLVPACIYCCRNGVVVHRFERSEEHTSELQSQSNLVCRLLLEKKKDNQTTPHLVT